MLATRFEGRPPRLLRMPRAVIAFAYLLSGLVQLRFDFIIKFKLILEEFLKPFLEFYLFLRREFRDGGFDFLHGAHVDKSTLRVRTRQGSRNCAVTVDGDGHWAEVPQGRPTMASPAIAERNDGDAGSDRAAVGDGTCGLRGKCLRESEGMNYAILRDPFQEPAKMGWEEEDLGRRRKGDFGKVKIARRLRRKTTVTKRWIAKQLLMGSVSNVTFCLVRGRKQ